MSDFYDKHGMTNTPTYATWERIVSNARKGTTEMTPSWDRFVNFLKDMGVKPEGTRLIKRDVGEPYCKDNCFYGTKEQAGGRTANGKYYREYRRKKAAKAAADETA